MKIFAKVIVNPAGLRSIKKAHEPLSVLLVRDFSPRFNCLHVVGEAGKQEKKSSIESCDSGVPGLPKKLTIVSMTGVSGKCS